MNIASTRAIGVAYTRAPSAEEIEWQLKGLCASGTYDPDLWTPTFNREDVEEAKAICAHCPVMMTCRRWALSHHEVYGVWGGLSENDRKAIWTGRRPRRRYNRRVDLVS